MQKRLQFLVERAEQIAAADAPRRRTELIEMAVAAGHTHTEADQIYDLAEQEGVDPTFAFELVLNGIGVRDLTPPNGDEWVETQVEAPPDWVREPDPAPDSAARERHMRTTFRRLRRMFELHPTPRAALEAFAREPDVAEVNY
ncbi:MAG TPA: hypothetical protein VFO52_08350 [Longimicrobiales bacterium]|nr:hypothetical protein [Longimicrobiales bacterium]